MCQFQLLCVNDDFGWNMNAGFEAFCIGISLLISSALWLMFWSASAPDLDAQGEPLKREPRVDYPPPPREGPIEITEKRIKELERGMPSHDPRASLSKNIAAKQLDDEYKRLAKLKSPGGGAYPSSRHMTPDDSKRTRTNFFVAVAVLTIVFSFAVGWLLGWGFSIGLSLVAATVVAYGFNS